jgi:hypothetical protein
MDWQQVLPSNHDSIRHEGVMGYIHEIDAVVNFLGNIPSPIFGQETVPVNQFSIWNLKSKKGFKQLYFENESYPKDGGYFFSFPQNKFLFYKVNEEIFKLEITKN